MTRRSILAALALVTGLAGGLTAGCGHDDPKPKFAHSSDPGMSSSAPTAPSSSSSTPAGPPNMPIEASEHTLAGAKLFARYLVQVIDYTNQTADTSRLKSISGEQCGVCQGVIKELDKQAARHRKSSGGQITTKSIHVVKLLDTQNGPAMRVRLSLHYAAQVLTYPQGGGRTSDPAIDVRYEVTLNPIDTGWELASWVTLK